MDNKLVLVATCLFGLEKLVGEEIDALGYKRIETIDGRVTFEGDMSAIARCNINFRYAERLYLKLGSFNSLSFTDLFDGTKSLPWEEWIDKNDEFPVKGHCIKSKLFSVPDCQKIVKKAVVERLKNKYGISWFDETGIKKQIEFFIFNDKADLMIDLSGVPSTKGDIGLHQAELLFARHWRRLWLKSQDPEKTFCFGTPFAVLLLYP